MPHRSSPAGRPALLLASLAVLSLLGCGSTNNESESRPDSPPSIGPGVTDGELRVGVEFVDIGGAGAAADALGVNGVSAGNGDSLAKAQVAAINADGGVLGRQLATTSFGYNPTGDPIAIQEQKLCTQFTQDEPVFAALVLPIHTDSLRTCLEDAGVLVVASGLTPGPDEQTFDAYPHQITAGTMSLSRLPKVLVDSLASDGLLTSSSKVGVITTELPAWVRASDSLHTELAAAGITTVKEVRVPALYRVDDVNGALTVLKNALLEFRTAGVDRVLFLSPTGSSAFFFMGLAEPQGYRPRYGLTSNDELQKVQTQVSPNQLAGAMGIGWIPRYDVSPTEALAPAATACLDRLKAAGAAFVDGNAEAAALASCDQFAVLIAALKAGGSPDRDSAIRGLESLGTSVEPASTFALEYGPDRHDGLAAVSSVAFDAACQCFNYQGAPHEA